MERALWKSAMYRVGSKGGSHKSDWDIVIDLWSARWESSPCPNLAKK